MTTFIVMILVLLSTLFSLNHNNLLYSLILLELIGFISLVLFVLVFNGTHFIYPLALVLFVFFVVEGVLGLVGMVLMLNFSGTDYLSLSVQSTNY